MKEIYIKETPNFIGQEIDLYGWVSNRRDHGKILFIDLKDSTGFIQVVFTPHMGEVEYEKACKLRSEWAIMLKGTVKERPENMKNSNIVTGGIEFECKEIEIISEANTEPFDTSTDGLEINEELRLKKRYIDLKRNRLQNNLRKRNDVGLLMRNFLSKNGFIEVETPFLSKTTPEGARDFLVPSRLSPGKFYGLPQSPQQYKQLLMISQVERYFQLVRCFRDEDPRGDRQAEFTQLDLEVSFWDKEQVLKLMENLIKEIVETLYPEKKLKWFPFPRLNYSEVMEKYGSDKPDLRENKEDKNELAFAYVVDFPMFEWHEKQQGEEARFTAVHHPFTKIDFEKDLSIQYKIQIIKNNPGELKAIQYDMILNGYEVGGGSIRETNTQILESVFELLGNTKEDFEEKFKHYIEAFGYGVPYHGGIALGFDRLMMILQNEETIREVMAFPKTGDNCDLMMEAPSTADEKQLKELHLKIN